MKTLVLLLTLLVVSTLGAQDARYQADAFSIRLPSGWHSEGSANAVRSSDPNTGAVFHALAAESLESAQRLIGSIADEPTDVSTVVLPSGEWTQQTFIDQNMIIIIWIQPADSLTHLMAVRASLASAQSLIADIESAIASYQISGRDITETETVPVVYPDPIGKFMVARADVLWTDKARRETYSDDASDLRQLPVTIWIPASGQGRRLGWLSPALAEVFAQQTEVSFDDLADIQVNALDQFTLAATDSPFPVVVMSHGDVLFPALYTRYAESLASHGYVVFAVTHPYNAALAVLSHGHVAAAVPQASAQPTNLTPDMRPIEIAEAVDRQGKAVVAIHAADIRFVIDQILHLNIEDPRFAGRLDLDRIGVFGHSLGGATAFESLISDRRLDAAINLDGTIFTDFPVGFDRPTMTIASEYAPPPSIAEDDLAALGMSREEYEQVTSVTTRATQLLATSSQARFVTIAGTQHMNFTDAGLVSTRIPVFSYDLGDIDPGIALEISTAYLIAFFDEHLRGLPTVLADLPYQYPDSTLVGSE